MSRPISYIGFDFQDDDLFMQEMLAQRKTDSEHEKMLENQKKRLECKETMPDDEPIPQKSLDFEEVYQSDKLPEGYESPFRLISFVKEDVNTVNTMSHCTPDEIAKLIRNIQNSVYSLGLEEARQCRRGKLLQVLSTTDSSPRHIEPTPPKIEKKKALTSPE